MKRLLISLLIAMSLTGCASINIKRPVSESDLKSTRRIGVVAVLGETFHGISVGTTVFNNEYFSTKLSGWDIDGLAAQKALALLRTNPRFAVAALDVSGAQADELRANDGKLLWEAATKQGFDRLAILRPSVSDNYPFFRPGFGLFERSFLGQNNRCVYVAYTVEVYDVATRQTIAWEWGGEGPCVRGMDNDVDFKKQFAEYSSDEQAMLRRKLDFRLDVSLRYAFEKLQLLRLALPNTR